MKTKKIKRRITSIRQYIEQANVEFNLRDAEIDVLAEYIAVALLERKAGVAHWRQVRHFSQERKNQIAQALGFKRNTSINVYIKRLREKGVFTGEFDEINPLVFPAGQDRTEVYFDWDINWQSEFKPYLNG